MGRLNAAAEIDRFAERAGGDLTGRQYAAKQALKLGMVDSVVHLERLPGVGEQDDSGKRWQKAIL